MLAAGAEARHHPLREHLRALQWDGVSRLDDWLIRHLGAEDDPDGLHRAYGRKWLISAIARAMNPDGASKVDTMLVLEGRQGLKKSAVFEIIAGRQEWFTDNLGDITTKAAWENMQGVWIVELAELSSVTKADVDALKGFMSRKADPFRPAYGFVAKPHLRQCVFGGTVNPGSNGYLKDETGARRFWCVECGVGWDDTREIDVAALRAERDQLLAEAVVHYDKGEIWYLDDQKLQRAQAVSASSRYEADLWQDAIEDYLSDKHVTKIPDILEEALKFAKKDCEPRESRRVGAILRVLKWISVNRRFDGGKQSKRFVSPEYLATDGRCYVARPHPRNDLDSLLADAA